MMIRRGPRLTWAEFDVHCVFFMFLISDLLNLNWTEIHLSGAELLSIDLRTLMFPLNQCHGVKGCQMGLAHLRDMIRVSL